ncbi:MAG: hypothetical protein ACLQLG_09195 [Thermoguttaceae bacterium]
MFGLFKKRAKFDEGKKSQFIEAVAGMLQLQLATVTRYSIESADGSLKPKAIGYVYGFIDAALRTIGQDMSDVSVGVPVTFHVLRRIFPGHEEKYMQYLADHMPIDETVLLGAMTGGQQWLDYNAGKLSVPMGMALFILEEG